MNVKAAEIEPVKGSAIATTDNLNVRSGPGKEYDAMGKVDEGASFNVTGVSDEWVEIDYYGDKGYLSMNYVTLELFEDEIMEDDVETEDEQAQTGDEFSEEVPEVGEETSFNYKLVFGLIGAIVVVCLVILLTIKSITGMDRDDDDDYEYDDDYDEDYEEDDYYGDEEDDDDEYEYVTIRRPKQPSRQSSGRQPQYQQSARQPQYRQDVRQSQYQGQSRQQGRKSSSDDYLIDIDPRYFD